MKVSEPKPASVTAVSQNQPAFFNKAEGSFLSRKATNDTAPFFTNISSHAYPPAIQAKHAIGQPNDKYEQEADAMADKVVQRLETPDVQTKNGNLMQAKSIDSEITPFIQTKCATCDQEEKLQKKEEGNGEEVDGELQRKPVFERGAETPDDENTVQRKCAECEREDKRKVQTKSENNQSHTAPASIESNLSSLKGRGNSLPVDTRLQMESLFGTDFSNVRIHNESNAAQMSKNLNAQAFTHGSDIYFNSGKYDTNSLGGNHLLAHELTHVVQQRDVFENYIQKKEIRIICNFEGEDELKAPPNAANILLEHYTHLAKVITSSQLDQIQKVLDAKEKIFDLREKQKIFDRKIIRSANGYLGDPYSVDKYDFYESKISEQKLIIGQNVLVVVDSKLLAADDIFDAGIDANPAIQAFHKQLYKRFTTYPILIEVHPCLNFGKNLSQFLEFYWQTSASPPSISHDKGLIRFRSLMQYQTLNLDYQSVLYGELVKVSSEMAELRRGLGDYYPEAVGKRIGVIDQGLVFSDDTVSVGQEIGDKNGYYNDGRGRMEMNNALYSSHLKDVARVVLRSKANWLHIFAANPNFDTTEMDDPVGDEGWLFILTDTKSPDIEIYEDFITKDGRDLQPATTRWNGSGWRTERELTEFEEFAIGVIFGDAFEANSGSAMFGQILTSMIPFVGQIADVRDVIVGVHKIYTTGGKEGKLQTGFAMLGFVPILGDYLKRESKVAKNAAPEVKAVAHTDAVVKTSQDIGDGIAEKAAKKIEDATEKGGKQGAEDALRSLDHVEGKYVKSVMESAGKAADDITPGLRQAEEITADASEAFGRQLPSIENPKLVAQASFKLAEQVHHVKVVQIGNWKQVWVCSAKCGSLIAKIDGALADATGAAAERLNRLRNSAADLEKKVNFGKISPSDIDKKVGRISFEMDELAKRIPGMDGLAKMLEDDLSEGAIQALARGFPSPPTGYHWRYADNTLHLVKSGDLPKLIFNTSTYRFEIDEAVREAKRFEVATTAAEAFAELGGKDITSDFGKFVGVLEKELGIPPKKIIADIELQNSKGFTDALQDTVRHRAKSPYVEMLYTRISDPAHLVTTDVYKRVLAAGKDANKALKAASHAELMRISRQLGNADKGSLGERWFQEWFASRGEHIKTQAKLGPEQGIIHESSRKIDIYEDYLAREVKNVTTDLGAAGTDQLEDLLIGAGKDVKIDNIITGYDSVRLVFLDPVGGAANANWMINNLKKFKDSPLSFQILNKEGAGRVVRFGDIANLGEDGVRKYILDWTGVQPKLNIGSPNDK